MWTFLIGYSGSRRILWGRKYRSIRPSFGPRRSSWYCLRDSPCRGFTADFSAPGDMANWSQSPWSEACRYPWSVVAELEGERINSSSRNWHRCGDGAGFCKRAAAYFTLPGNRCKVRAHESAAKPIPHNGHGQSARYIGGTAAMPTRHNGKRYKPNENNRMEQMYTNAPNSQQYNSLKHNKTENPRVGGSIPSLGTI